MVDITERYRTLRRYMIAVSEDEMSAALSVETRWRKLYVDSRTRDLRLVDTKVNLNTLYPLPYYYTTTATLPQPYFLSYSYNVPPSHHIRQHICHFTALRPSSDL
jgi:hypothetical protein